MKKYFIIITIDVDLDQYIVNIIFKQGTQLSFHHLLLKKKIKKKLSKGVLDIIIKKFYSTFDFTDTKDIILAQNIIQNINTDNKTELQKMCGFILVSSEQVLFSYEVDGWNTCKNLIIVKRKRINIREKVKVEDIEIRSLTDENIGCTIENTGKKLRKTMNDVEKSVEFPCYNRKQHIKRTDYDS